jgi:hypothetical protein
MRGLLHAQLDAAGLPAAGEELAALPCWQEGWVAGCQITGYRGQSLGEGLRRSPVPLGVHSFFEWTDGALASLAGLNNLFQLEVHSRGLTDAGLTPLAGLPNLRTLHLWDCPHLTDAGLPSLAALSGLTSLGLGRCDITDRGLGHVLEWLLRLDTLTLLDCPRLTDAALDHVAEYSGLRCVQLFCPGFSPEGAERLRRALPGCLVTR